MQEFDCPICDCEECPYHRSVSWCAQAIPKHEAIDDFYKVRMEGFWEGIRTAEDGYKLYVDFFEETNDYVVMLDKLIDKLFAENRGPTHREMNEIKKYWE